MTGTQFTHLIWSRMQSLTTHIRSIYFYDSGGICLEFAAWAREIDPKRDVVHAPVDAQGHWPDREPAE